MASEFRPSKKYLESSVISALTWDLSSEVAQFVEASRTFFVFQSIFLIGPSIAITLGFVNLSISTAKPVGLIGLLIALPFFFGYYYLFSVRNKRRAHLADLRFHYHHKNIKLVISEEFIKSYSAVFIHLPNLDKESLGKQTETILYTRDIQRLSIYRSRSAKVVALEIKIDNDIKVLNHFEDKQALANALKTVTPSSLIEELPRLIPKWIPISCIVLALLGLGAWYYFFLTGMNLW